MNVFTENTVSEYLLQRSVAGFPKLRKKKRKPQKITLTHQMRSTKTCNKDNYLNNFRVLEHITDGNKVMTPI